MTITDWTNDLERTWKVHRDSSSTLQMKSIKKTPAVRLRQLKAYV